MAITNREILQNQVRRIKKKTGKNLELHYTNLFCYLYERKDDGTLEEAFASSKIARKKSEMMDYLAGLEDAIDTMPKKVYFVKCEVNDQGWHSGYHHFTKLEDAIKLMRNYVARQLWYSRRKGKEIFIKTFRDSVMNSLVIEESQTIFVRIGEDTFEYRVWSEELNYSERPKDKCINY